MKIKKRNKLFFVSTVILIFIVSITLYMIYNPLATKGDVKLNLFEQRWIENNKNKIINIFIPNDIPLYSNEGKGIVFSFLDYFEEQTELEFNKTPYTIGESTGNNSNYFHIVRGKDKLKDSELLFYNDNYVVVSRTSERKVSLNDLTGNIGVLEEDFNDISTYLNVDKLTLTRIKDIDSLMGLFTSNEFSYIIVPKNLYLSQIIKTNSYIINSLNDLTLRYVLTLDSKNNRLNDIVRKYYTAWADNYLTDDYNKELFNLYTTVRNVDDKSKTEFKSKRYIYGYVDNLPYEEQKKDELNGLSNEFIDAFTSFSDVEFNFKRFNSAVELDKALTNGQIDIAMNYYALNTANTYRTLDLLYSNYVIIAKDGRLVIDSIRSLDDKDIYTFKGTRLGNYINKHGNFNVKEVDMVSALEDKDLVVLDENTYNYYAKLHFKNHTVVYRGILDDNYGYIINKTATNELFYNIFNYYLSTINHEQYKRIGMDKVLHRNISLDLSLLWLYVILLPIFLSIVVLIMRKRRKIIKLRSDVKLKYIDPLTSLKNRYYLNNNITKWEENNIYPQAMVVININNLKDINDAYGYEGGDQLIKTAANILINNQMEKTDIMRTDGNEFVIYMVGYDESAVLAYVRKLYRLLKDLPYEYGASLGYSMIEDDIKTIEDAINEAILDMVTNRETKQNNEY